MKRKKHRPGKPDGMNYMNTLAAGAQAQRAAIDAAAQAKFDRYVRRLYKMCIDAAFMAANDVFHMGSTRCEAFGRAMVDYLNEMAVMMQEDAPGRCGHQLHQREDRPETAKDLRREIRAVGGTL